jgi:cell pole-organizing protein PopZ
MTDLPPTIDAIMASIRARVTGVVAPDAEAPPAPMAAAPVVAPAPDGALTIEALFRQLAEPQIKAWLDAHLPELVERIATMKSAG